MSRFFVSYLVEPRNAKYCARSETSRKLYFLSPLYFAFANLSIFCTCKIFTFTFTAGVKIRITSARILAISRRTVDVVGNFVLFWELSARPPVIRSVHASKSCIQFSAKGTTTCPLVSHLGERSRRTSWQNPNKSCPSLTVRNEFLDPVGRSGPRRRSPRSNHETVGDVLPWQSRQYVSGDVIPSRTTDSLFLRTWGEIQSLSCPYRVDKS